MTAPEADPVRRTKCGLCTRKADYSVKDWGWGYNAVKYAACAQHTWAMASDEANGQEPVYVSPLT